MPCMTFSTQDVSHVLYLVTQIVCTDVPQVYIKQMRARWGVCILSGLNLVAT